MSRTLKVCNRTCGSSERTAFIFAPYSRSFVASDSAPFDEPLIGVPRFKIKSGTYPSRSASSAKLAKKSSAAFSLASIGAMRAANSVSSAPLCALRERILSRITAFICLVIAFVTPSRNYFIFVSGAVLYTQTVKQIVLFAIPSCRRCLLGNLLPFLRRKAVGARPTALQSPKPAKFHRRRVLLPLHLWRFRLRLRAKVRLFLARGHGHDASGERVGITRELFLLHGRTMLERSPFRQRKFKLSHYPG